MTLGELLALVIDTFPDAVIDETHVGEVVIYTGLRTEAGEMDPDDRLVKVSHYV